MSWISRVALNRGSVELSLCRAPFGAAIALREDGQSLALGLTAEDLRWLAAHLTAGADALDRFEAAAAAAEGAKS